MTQKTQQIWDPKNVGTKKMLFTRKIGFQQIFCSKKVWVKVCQKNQGPKNIGLNFFRSVTAETFLILTNNARINVAWINVTMTIGIGKRWSQDPTFKVWSKSDQ